MTDQTSDAPHVESRLSTSWRESQIRRAIEQGIGESSFVQVVQKARDRLSELPNTVSMWFESSVSGQAISSVERSFQRSRLHGFVTAGERWVRNSYLFHWLTKEPDPDVIIIDLRETVTIGPFIRLLDRFLPVLVNWIRGSLIYELYRKLKTKIEEVGVREFWLVRLMVRLLEPPELPEDHGE